MNSLDNRETSNKEMLEAIKKEVCKAIDASYEQIVLEHARMCYKADRGEVEHGAYKGLLISIQTQDRLSKGLTPCEYRLKYEV